MPRLYVARRAQRKGLYLPMGANSQNPMLLFPLLRKSDPGELEELIRIELEKAGVTKESDVQAVLDKAETDYELRLKVDEVKRETRRLMALRAAGKSLMQVGHKKWKEVWYPRVGLRLPKE